MFHMCKFEFESHNSLKICEVYRWQDNMGEEKGSDCKDRANKMRFIQKRNHAEIKIESYCEIGVVICRLTNDHFSFFSTMLGLSRKTDIVMAITVEWRRNQNNGN